jgi:hypothetical protein
MRSHKQQPPIKMSTKDNSVELYHLYCININCMTSIYHNNVEIKVILDVENLASTHICVNCRRQLYSAMDIEIEQITAMAGVKTMDKPYYNSNH